MKLNKRSCDPRQLVNGSRLTAVPEENAGSVVSTPGFSFLLFLRFLPKGRWRGDLCHIHLHYFRWPGMKQRWLERVSRVRSNLNFPPQGHTDMCDWRGVLQQPTTKTAGLCLLSSKPASHCLNERCQPNSYTTFQHNSISLSKRQTNCLLSTFSLLLT